MERISHPTRLECVEYILSSGNGILDFAIDGRDEYVTWHGLEAAD